ncbi:MAG: hypothetical protein Q4D60_04360 [Eubacteriales bacterium]|nr:hypothetical protein [Eubacteriales bacterium]
MVAQEFTKLYYRTANCLTSDIIADFAPVSRIMGVDVSSGMGVVFTAMGTRFDMQYVAKEAFAATDNYEADTRSIDDAPVTEVMRYIRSELVAGDKVPEEYKAFTKNVLAGESVFKQFSEYEEGEKDAQTIFLISPSAMDPKKTAKQFSKVAGEAGERVRCTNQYKDCGYLLLQLGQMDRANALAGELMSELGKYERIVTDDSYVLDALLVLCPELGEKIQFIDEFCFEIRKYLSLPEKNITLHESGVVERLYPGRKVDYCELFPKSEVKLPQRNGFDVTDSGIAGGLGLAEPGNLVVIAKRRMMDLSACGQDVIVTPCACEALGLNCAEGETVKTLLEYICE